MIMKNNRTNRNCKSAAGALIGVLLLCISTFSGNFACAAGSDAISAVATPLTLENGWTNAPFGTSNAAVVKISTIVHFKGAIAGGASGAAFVLPPAFRPGVTTYVPVDLCNAAKGRLVIEGDGVVSVEAEHSFSSAQCFTSLDGASFAQNGFEYSPLDPINGWTCCAFGTEAASVRNINGVVHLNGTVAGGSSPEILVLYPGDRPATVVYVPVDLCNAANGRLIITPNGEVQVQAETTFASAQCFTSLEGAWFVAATTGYKNLELLNGWVGAPFSTSMAAVGRKSGVVYLKGAIATSGTDPVPFILPKVDRPKTNVYVPVDLCAATNGRLLIEPSGVVSVQAETAFRNAQCFTSLDGVSFVQ